MKTVGQRIIKARELKGWSRPRLAQESGVPYPTLAGLENGDQQTSSWIPAIAAATGVNALWLANGKGEMLVGTRASSQFGRFDPDMVADTVTALLVALRRRDKSATLDLQNPLDAALFCEAYAELEALEGSPGGEVAAGAVIADLVAIREERRNARGEGGEGQQRKVPMKARYGWLFCALHNRKLKKVMESH